MLTWMATRHFDSNSTERTAALSVCRGDCNATEDGRRTFALRRYLPPGNYCHGDPPPYLTLTLTLNLTLALSLITQPQPSGVTIIFGPPADIRYWLTVLIGYIIRVTLGPLYRFGPLSPPALPGLPMASYATATTPSKHPYTLISPVVTVRLPVTLQI